MLPIDDIDKEHVFEAKVLTEGHVARDGSNAIAVTADVHDVAAVLEAISSPPAELGAAMEKHGVIPPLAVYVDK